MRISSPNRHAARQAALALLPRLGEGLPSRRQAETLSIGKLPHHALAQRRPRALAAPFEEHSYTGPKHSTATTTKQLANREGSEGFASAKLGLHKCIPAYGGSQHCDALLMQRQFGAPLQALSVATAARPGGSTPPAFPPRGLSLTQGNACVLHRHWEMASNKGLTWSGWHETPAELIQFIGGLPPAGRRPTQ